MSRILVTGGAGFIGSHLIDVLLSKGNSVVAADNMSLGRRENLKSAFTNDSFELVEMDVTDQKALQKLFAEKKFDMVFHLAANSDIARSHADPSTDLNNTLLTTFSVLEAMRINDVKKLMFASTSAIYGNANGEAVTENYGPLFPASHYGACKLASEGLISSYSENYGIQAFICRFPNVCGERTTHGILHDFVKKLKKNPNELEVLGNGQQAKPYLYVKDLVSAILYVCENGKDKVNYFNLGGNGQTPVWKIAQMVIDAMGLKAQIRYTGGDRGWVGDVPKFAYNLDKIKAFGWQPSLNSDEAVMHAIKGILQEDLCSL